MPLILPDLSAVQCRFLTVCGEVDTEDEELIEFLREAEPTDVQQGDTFVLASGGGRLGKHLHFDVAHAEYFRGPPPVPRGSLEDINSIFDRVHDLKVDCSIEGSYRMTQSQLPSLIRSSFVETRSGDVSLRNIGGRIAIEGAPIDELSWRIPKVGVGAEIELASNIKTTIGDSYLVDALIRIEDAFRALILEG